MVLIIGNNSRKIESTWRRMIQISGIESKDIKTYTSWKDLISEDNWEKTVKNSYFILLDHHLYSDDQLEEENETNGRYIFSKLSEISPATAQKVYGISTEIGVQDYLEKDNYLGNKDPDKVFRLFEQLRRN